ncbi:unnamed protein product [Prorocentrum cordatum]|nr:unnamed protein product [Polarella glacialis]
MMHVTLELGDEKSPGPQRLGAEWAANRRALYGLIAQVHAGARGRVLCACGAGPARPATKATLTFLPGAPPRACGAGCGAAPPPLAQEIATRADPSTGHYHRVLLPGAARRGVGRARREQQRIAKLDQVLQTVPYQYENRAALRNHVVNLLQSTPTLVPAAQEFRSPGKTATLFYLGGVLPINYKGATYNIPVTIYAVVCGPPRCFVTPSGSMALKQPHPNVDAGGMITELIPAVGAVFSQNPPVYSTQPAAAPECLHGRSLLNSQMGTALMGNGLPVAAATPVPVRPTATISAAQRALYFTAPSFEPPVIQPGHSGAKERLIAEATRGLRERWTLALDPVVDDLNAQADRKAALQAAAAKVGGQMEDLRRAAADAGRDAEDLKAKEEELRKFLERQAEGKEPHPHPESPMGASVTPQTQGCMVAPGHAVVRGTRFEESAPGSSPLLSSSASSALQSLPRPSAPVNHVGTPVTLSFQPTLALIAGNDLEHRESTEAGGCVHTSRPARRYSFDTVSLLLEGTYGIWSVSTMGATQLGPGFANPILDGPLADASAAHGRARGVPCIDQRPPRPGTRRQAACESDLSLE